MTETTSESLIVDPELPVVDAHHHLINKGPMRYMLDDFLEDLGAGHRITHTVYIETRTMARSTGPEHLRPVGEVEFASGVAAMAASGDYGPTAVCAGIVGYADLRHEGLEEVLDEQERAGGGRFKGIRQGAYWDAYDEMLKFATMRPPRHLLLDEDFRRGFDLLGRRGFSFDAVVFHPQLGEVEDLVKHHDQTQVILNHMGFPLGMGPYAGHRQEVFEVWKQSMQRLAAHPSVAVKLGGCGIPFWGFGFDQRKDRVSPDELVAAWSPYIRTCIDLFGVDRCLMESNFPADRPSCGYVELWNALKKTVADFSEAEKRALFADTASDVYRLAK